MTESEMKSLLSFGASRGRSYGTVDRRYLGESMETKHFVNYTVRQDDTLTSLAVQFSISVHQLKRVNKMYMTSDTIEPGRILKIPVRESQTEATKLVPSPPPPKPQITPPMPKVEKVDDFFKQIDLGIKSSKSRLNKVDSQVLETLENQDTFYDGYIKL